jgi:hypothetical protein
MICKLLVNLFYFIETLMIIITISKFIYNFIITKKCKVDQIFIFVQNKCLNLSYNLLYFFSNFQIFYTKINNNINKKIIDFIQYYDKNCNLMFFIEHLNKKEKNFNELEYIKNNKIVKIDKKETVLDISFDFIIYTDYSKINNKYFNFNNNLYYTSLNNCFNKIIYYKNPDNYNYNYEISQFKFILLELLINKYLYKIELKTDDYNFYIVNNVLDKNFFMYYLVNFLKYNEEKNDEILLLKIIDQNVKIFEIDLEKQFISINKTDYNIINK